MKPPRALGALLVLAALRLLLHTLTNGQYGFHRDELATLDDARHLAWGFVAYPPLTPFVARIVVELFGTTPSALRFFTALAQCIIMVLAGLMARELGGGRKAQIIAALAVAVSPVSMAAGHLFQYVSFDFLWGVLALYFIIRLLESGGMRWWIAVGVAFGLGLMTRYTIVWLAAGLAVGFLATPARRFLNTRWLIGGMAVALAIALPNLIWQANHAFISIDFLRSIHARDVRIGRTDGFLWRQLLVPASLFTVPLWIAGLWFYFRQPRGERYRALGFTFLATLALFAAAQGRDYYTAPLYPMLLAAGAVVSEQWPRWAGGLNWAGLALALSVRVAFSLPIAPIASPWFNAALRVNGDLREEIGWPDLVDEVATIRDSLPAGDRANAGILTGNYGEAGAIDLYGPAKGLPQALTPANSFWLRGYGDNPPQTLIVVGLSPKFVHTNFSACESRGTIKNRYGVENEETKYDRYLWVCRGLREPWPEFWRKNRAWE
jgi:MFS family permease